MSPLLVLGPSMTSSFTASTGTLVNASSMLQNRRSSPSNRSRPCNVSNVPSTSLPNDNRLRRDPPDPFSPATLSLRKPHHSTSPL
ncbi:hypothetical protein SISSUDRAFT_1051563 [Sistotremastrum suecicum HHB10207 ss-3]|uniref:Uncharacterized protein n=1 Tax=Sistotremastrum suecicum HHB10207 ss-3 TaxID=1314776 RepID=A0A166AHR9_9AGAM|nr:hypothetical protein SISSUDRAFT_1051563 [Sistotremastrum suecicum HHB10207 ss-3]